MHYDKHFTLEEARTVLNKLKPYVSEMISLKKILDNKGFDISRHQYFGGMGPNGTGPFPPELDDLVNVLKVISSEGVLIKGIDNGLLDFPYIRENNEEIFLCWMDGEDDILFWHPVDTGYQGRRSIEEL